jgi:hypothetical protein
MWQRPAHFISLIRRTSTSHIVPKILSGQCGHSSVAGVVLIRRWGWSMLSERPQVVRRSGAVAHALTRHDHKTVSTRLATAEVSQRFLT